MRMICKISSMREHRDEIGTCFMDMKRGYTVSKFRDHRIHI